jgi:hypothetical protein
MEQAKFEYIDKKSRIDILLKEYDVLNTQIISRINNRFAITGLLCFVGSLIFFKSDETTNPIYTWFGPAASVFVLLLLLVIWFILGKLIKNLSVRVSQIEKKINSLAGEELLIWETFQIENGIFHKVFR